MYIIIYAELEAAFFCVRISVDAFLRAAYNNIVKYLFMNYITRDFIRCCHFGTNNALFWHPWVRLYIQICKIQELGQAIIKHVNSGKSDDPQKCYLFATHEFPPPKIYESLLIDCGTVAYSVHSKYFQLSFIYITHLFPIPNIFSTLTNDNLRSYQHKSL